MNVENNEPRYVISIAASILGIKTHNLRYYEKMGLRFNYNQIFDFARKSLKLPDISAFTSIEKEDYFINIF